MIFKSELKSPDGYEINFIGEINITKGVKAFQFVNDEVGYAMSRNNIGGYVEVFKTIDGGQTWSDLEIGIDQHPKNILFKDENFGIITVLDDSGCPPPNCENKCVILKTENGGMNWEEVILEDLEGVLYHPKYARDGNLYAILELNGQTSLMKSADNGTSWALLYSSSDLGFTFSTFSFEIFEDKIFISGTGGKIVVVSTNGQLLKTIEIEELSIWDLEIIDENNLIVVLSSKVLKTTDGGDNWETIYEEAARMIGFDSNDKGLMLVRKSSCPSDVYQVNELIASTDNGGLDWTEPEDTTTNLRIYFSNSQKMGDGLWYIMIQNKLFEIKEV